MATCSKERRRARRRESSSSVRRGELADLAGRPFAVLAVLGDEGVEVGGVQAGGASDLDVTEPAAAHELLDGAHGDAEVLGSLLGGQQIRNGRAQDVVRCGGGGCGHGFSLLSVVSFFTLLPGS